MSLDSILPVPPREFDQWHPPAGYDGVEVDPRFGELADQMRRLNAVFTGAAPWGEAVGDVIDDLERAIQTLSAFAVPEGKQIVGRRFEIPGRGQALVPAFVVDNWSRSHVEGRFSFSRFHLGGHGAAHGGAIALIFDDVLGRLSNTDGRSRARTAYLKVDFREVVPVEEEMVLIGRIEAEEGRKRIVTGRIVRGGATLAECDALFVALKPGQT